MNINIVNHFPLISCLCVSKNRSFFLKKSMDLFRNQTYPNKELIIVYYEDDIETKKMSTDFRDDNIRFYENSKESKLTLGDLRNHSVEVAQGEIVCIWDDDDYYSPDRLIKQFIQLKASGKHACTLQRLAIYDCVENRLGITHHRIYGWEGSLMCKTDEMKANLYLSLNKQEDTKVIDELGKNGALHIMEDFMLYTYFFHSRNTSGREHLNKLWDENYLYDVSDKIPFLEKKIITHIELHKQIL